jgi:hypothetical protein
MSLAIAGRRPGMLAAALIAWRVGLLHDAEEGASRVLKHNEVVFSTIPPGISPRSQSDQSLNFGLLVRGIEVEMKPTPAAGTPIATLEREIGTFVLWVTENHPAVFRRLAARNEAPPAKRQPCGRSRGNESRWTRSSFTAPIEARTGWSLLHRVRTNHARRWDPKLLRR